jgi:serine/threonine-protein kinase RsbW
MSLSANRLSLPATAESITAFCEFARRGAVAGGVPDGEMEKLDLVLEEILINVARYAYGPEGGPVELAYWPGGTGRLRIEIADSGRFFNPLEVDPPDLTRGLAERAVGGLGVFLVKSLVGSIAYRREDERNILSFTFPADS